MLILAGEIPQEGLGGGGEGGIAMATTLSSPPSPAAGPSVAHRRAVCAEKKEMCV